MSPRTGFVILVGPALWLAGSAVGAQQACGAPEGAGPRIEAAAPVVVRTEGATACVCGFFPDRTALEGLRIAGRPVEASVDELGRVATIRLPPDLPPGRHEVTGAPEAGFGPEDRVDIHAVSVSTKEQSRLLPFGRGRKFRITIAGTEEPVELRVRNQAPQIIALKGGLVFDVRTSGGQSNRAVVRGRMTGTPGRGRIAVDFPSPPCPCAAGGPEGLPLERVAALERCLAAAVAELEAWFDGRAEEFAARAARGALQAGEVIALIDELEERFLRVLATPEVAALRAWVEDELAREREVWARAPAGPVPAAARATSGYALAAGGGPSAPPILRAQAESSQSFGALFDRVKAFFGDLRSVSNDLVVELCVRSAPSGAVAWVQPKRYSEGRRTAQTTATEFLNLSRGIYVGEADGEAGRSAFEVDLVRRYAAYVECALGSSPCATPLRPAGFVCREDRGR
ncbi:MAG TPA: hypothetical protein VLF66_12755 [Thermoanaerobaculia bacterium]|nr:hypothetical protein [Thermoanaerobaculia bacterium]